ncbi:MAG TPA: O-antigen ligase family protein [Bryobacteraceae bacterium]
MQLRESGSAIRPRDNVSTVNESSIPKLDGFSLALCAVPASIALAEVLLAWPLVRRTIALCRNPSKAGIPRVFLFWSAWAAMEIFSWLHSPELQRGWGEMRHLLLIAGLFVLTPVMASAEANAVRWRGIVMVATLSSLVLIAEFVLHLFRHRPSLDPVVYLRGGGLLHHWMVYGIVETLVFAGLLELLHFFPEERWWLGPATAINVVAIVLSLTRTLWVCSLLILACHLAWTRSRWIWALPAIPSLLFLVAPGAVRTRIIDSARPDYYANSERVQMLQVGFRMVRENPFTGVGPGRVEEVYGKYLSARDTLPAYHGHLHNNVMQLAAEFGLPTLALALVFVGALARCLLRRVACAKDGNEQFLCRTALLGLLGFLAAGMFDYTYGHSLGIILLAFTVFAPLVSIEGAARSSKGHAE